MPLHRSPLELYKILPKTNCRQCYLPTCLAFAAAVVKGEKRLAECPHYTGPREDQPEPRQDAGDPYDHLRAEKIRKLQEQVAALDLGTRAPVVGAAMVGSRLAVKSLGKTFLVEPDGSVTSECHTHPGLVIPLLSYLLRSTGQSPTGRWVHFRELENGPPMSALFEKRGEKALQSLAEAHPDLLEVLLDIFSGERARNDFGSDMSLVLYPLPKLPVLICYWEAEDDLDSKLNIFFDATADQHLPIEYIFELGVGLVMMFQKIALKHC